MIDNIFVYHVADAERLRYSSKTREHQEEEAWK